MLKDNIRIPGFELFVEKKVKVGDIFINYAEAGEGKVIILIHGWTNNWTGLIPVASHLLPNYRVIIVDLPGYGESGRLKNYSVMTMASHLKGLIDGLKLRRVSLAGHSMGTFVVSKFLEMYPESIEKLILIGPVFRKNNKVRTLKATERFFSLADKHGRLQTVIDKVVKRDTFSYLTAKYLNMYKFDKPTVQKYGIVGKRKMSIDAYVDMGVEIAKLKMEKIIANNKKPILMVFGKYDKITNCEQAKEALLGLGNYKYEVIDKAGHVVTVEKPKQVAESIKKFLD
ncbi:MAG: alpha/beta fold hydrolase [Patescibacteria group bacterium]|jgi:pimeloyl-ACP methyl ester carboxylesterase